MDSNLQASVHGDEEEGNITPQDRYYKIKGVKFRQTELLYDQLLVVLKLIGSQLKDFRSSATEFGEMIDRWEKMDILPPLFRVVVSVDNRNPIRALLNRWHIWREGVNVGDPIRSMTAKQIARVSTDFFLLNVSLLITWLGTPMNSASSLKEATPVELYQVLTNIFSPPVRETSSKRSESGN